MSLTVLVHPRLPDVGIVRWFRDRKFSLMYSSGPLVQMSKDEFRRVGHEWARQHLAEYVKVRFPEERALPVFQPGQEESFLNGRVAVLIKAEDSGDLKFIPQVFRGHTLADSQNLPQETRRTISANSVPDVFWKTLDDAVAAAVTAEA